MTQAPALPSREDRLRLLEKVGKSLLAMPYKSWNFGDSTGFEGILEAGRLLKDPAYFSFANGWIRSWASRPEPFRRLDCTAPGVAMVEIAHETKDKEIIQSLNLLATYLMSRTKDRGIYDTWESLCLIPPYGGEEQMKQSGSQTHQGEHASTVFTLIHHFSPHWVKKRVEKIWLPLESNRRTHI